MVMLFNFVNWCSHLAPWACVVVYMAPFPTIQQVRRDKSVGSLPLLPYSSMAASSFIWTVYGFLKHEPKLWSCCIVGVALALYYLHNFIQYAPDQSPTFPGSVAQHVKFVALTVVATFVILSQWEWLAGGVSPTSSSASSSTSTTSTTTSLEPADILGCGGLVLSISMFAAPLAALQHVLTSKSAKSIPWPFTLASLVNCFLWSVTGLYEMNDANVYIPNVLGLTFALAQVSLKVLYGDGKNHLHDESGRSHTKDSKGKAKRRNSHDGTSIELPTGDGRRQMP